MSDDIERLLADLDSEEDAPENTEESVQENRPSRGIKQLRDAYKRTERERDKALKELEELRAFRETVETERTVATLTGAGLNEKQAAAYLKMYGEVKPEFISEFRTDVLGQEAGETESPATFAPAVGQVERSAKTYTKAEFEAIMRADPTEGWKILNSGKVKF